MSGLWFVMPVLALIAGIMALAPLGAQVLRRGVVFMDLAIAQAAAAGALAALALTQEHRAWITQTAAAAAALTATGLVAWLARKRPAHREALIGLVYVTCACTALLMARLDAHGSEHLQALLAADVLWSGPREVGMMALCALGVALMGPRLQHDRWFYGAFALVVSLAVPVLGLFIVFAALIAPAVWHRSTQHPGRAIMLAVMAALAGMGLSWGLDAPSGPLVALSLAMTGLFSPDSVSR
ncbi:metal ABC transporter permease [Limnohabitans sp.]|jgi:zinc/manganese transport system permease protein|uniref:metal ABC transporter permease n=1 Tax=Limnohabitans sp. TaxID=1907725 RepID=UPI00391ACE53